MLEELWLDSFWNKCDNGDESAEGREADSALWLCDENLDSDVDEEEESDEKEEEEDKNGSEFSEYEDTASDVLASEDLSGEEYDSDSQ
jgi:hypothetical protein